MELIGLILLIGAGASACTASTAGHSLFAGCKSLYLFKPLK